SFDYFCFFFFFFFSSRRRHTRSLRDWSSDVCSSDLEFHLVSFARTLGFGCLDFGVVAQQTAVTPTRFDLRLCGGLRHRDRSETRSEERRVGREGGCQLERTVYSKTK